MSKPKTILFLLFVVLGHGVFAQVDSSILQRYSNFSIFNLEDTTCLNLTGEWIGEEIQYDPSRSFIKSKFKVIFKLRQEGNKVYGTSFIQDKLRGSYGDMKLRGIVVGNKLHFEEYEIVAEQFFEKGIVWCLRSGELIIERSENKTILNGLEYKGYASDSYFQCTDYAEMRMVGEKDVLKTKKVERGRQVKNEINRVDLNIFPNPGVEQVTISYTIPEEKKVKIEIFNLSGTKVGTIYNGIQEAGNQKFQLNISEYLPGVYVLCVSENGIMITRQFVKTK